MKAGGQRPAGQRPAAAEASALSNGTMAATPGGSGANDETPGGTTPGETPGGAGETFEIKVRTSLEETELVLRVGENETVAELKRRVADESGKQGTKLGRLTQGKGISVEKQRMIFRGREAKDGDTVKSLKLASDMVLQLVVRP